MRWFESMTELEAAEDALRQQVNALPLPKRQAFYQSQSRQLKDPDTYAVLNWGFLGGLHHLYLRQYAIFAVEFAILIICLVGLWHQQWQVLYVLAALVLYELPQLLMAQKLARQYNLDVSHRIYQDLQAS